MGAGSILISNDNWMDDPVSAAQLTASGLAPQDPERVRALHLASTGRLHRDPGRQERRHRDWIGRDIQLAVKPPGRLRHYGLMGCVPVCFA